MEGWGRILAHQQEVDNQSAKLLSVKDTRQVSQTNIEVPEAEVLFTVRKSGLGILSPTQIKIMLRVFLELVVYKYIYISTPTSPY
jgi:hypothetical protein